MALLIRGKVVSNGLPQEVLSLCTASLQSRRFSVFNRPPPNYEGHVPLTRIERLGLAVGSAVTSFIDPTRPGNYSHCSHVG